MADSQMRIIIQAVDKASKEFKQIATNAKNMGGEMESSSIDMASGLLAVGKAAIAVTAAIVAAKKIFDFSEEGAQVQRLENASFNLAKSYGANMGNIVQSIQSASLDSISNMDAMQSAGRAMMLGLGSDADQMGQLMEIAAYRGRVMGVSTTQAFNDIVTGIGRKSRLILDNLGIIIDTDKAYTDYANTLGISVDQMDAAAQTQAYLNAVLKEGQALMEKGGGLTFDSSTAYERVRAGWKDFIDKLKEDVSFNILPLIASPEEVQQVRTQNAEVATSIRNAKELKDLYSDNSMIGIDSDYTQRLRDLGQFDELNEYLAKKQAQMNRLVADTMRYQGYEGIKAANSTESLAAETKNYTDESLLQAATMEDVTKAFEKYNAALEKANNISDKTKKDAAITEAFNEFGESIEDVTLKLAGMAGISASVLMNVSASMGEVDESTKEAFIAMTELLSLPASVQAQGILDINEMLGLGDPKAAAAKIKEYMNNLTTTSLYGIGGVYGTTKTDFGDMTATMGIDATLTPEASATIAAALAPGTKYIDIVARDAGGGGGGGGSSSGGSNLYDSRFRASGGPVQMGQPYVVGEHGIEMFVPNANGTIVPNNKLASGGSTFKFYDKVNFVLPDNGMNASDLMRQMGVAA